MKVSTVASLLLHLGLVALYFLYITLLSKPRMSYYAVDLMSSVPAGAPAAGAPSATPPPPIPEVKPPPKSVDVEKPLPREAIRVVGKVRPPLPQPKSKPASHALPSWATATSDHPDEPATPSNATDGGTTGTPSISADAGASFPYPWYLKQIGDKLYRQWHPPKDFQSGLLCVVSFVVNRGGEVSDILVEKSSGDSVYDQIAMRAVTYASPLPPLPSGYPEDTLNVHMKFVLKQ